MSLVVLRVCPSQRKKKLIINCDASKPEFRNHTFRNNKKTKKNESRIGITKSKGHVP